MWCDSYKNVRFLRGGREVGANGTPHIQGHIDLKNGTTISALQTTFRKADIRIAVRQLTAPKDDGGVHVRNNREYCLKDDDCPLEWGTPPKHGARNDLTAAMATAANPDTTQVELMEKHPLVCARYQRFLQHYRMMKMGEQLETLTHADEDTPNLWIWGEPGVSKSRPWQEAGAYAKPPNKWWTGYDSHDIVLVEDIDPSHHGMGYTLKIWGDRYPFRVCVHHSMIIVRPKRIIITSNYSMEEVFERYTSLTGENKFIKALLRRYKVKKI